MVTTFTSENGKIIYPKTFAVYTNRDGSSFKKIKENLDEWDLDEYEGIVRVDLYENGNENLSPVSIDSVSKK